MDNDIFKCNLKTLKEIVLDESRLVTYISLSKELCVHVNEAKLLLCEAVQDVRTKRPDIDLNVNYIISGLTDKCSGQTTVCSETDLNNIRKKFKIIFFDHIYSLSKGSSSVDRICLLAANKLEDLSLCSGLIKNNFCVKRTTVEVCALKLDSQEAVKDLKISKPQHKNINKQATPKVDHKEGHLNASDKNKEINKLNSANNIKAEIQSPKKTSNNLFNKNGGKASKSIDAFFNKTDTITKSNNQQKSESTMKEINTKIETKVKEEKMDVDDIKIENNNTAQKEANKPVKKPLNGMKKKGKIDKKRKRVLHVSDSESDNDTEDPFKDETPVNHESDDEIPPTPSVNTIKVTSGIVNPKKRRKIVDKTYVDDEGYILTKKEEVYESCSENEDSCKSPQKENLKNILSTNIETLSKEKKIVIKTEISPKEKKTKSKKKSPPKGNQQTIMNFFKKK